MIEIIVALIFGLYGVIAAISGERNTKVRLILASPMLILVLYMLLAVGIFSGTAFRVLFPVRFQFWGSVLIGEALIASAFLTIGWMLAEGIKRQRKDYTLLCIVFLIGVPLIYSKNFWIDYSKLSERTPERGYIQQTSSFSCSAASLANACSLLSYHVSEQECARLMRINRFGGSVYQMSYALDVIGLSHTEVSGRLVRELSLPAILVVDHSGIENSHAILVISELGGEYQVIDPLTGIMALRTNEWFDTNWNGIGIEEISNRLL